MEIGSVPNPESWEHWAKAKAFLEPARALGGFDSVIEPDEALWAVMEDGELLGCATARMCEGFVEIPLVGGRDFRRWIAELDNVIGAAGKDAGATWMLAMGRRGWVKILCALGWDVMGELDGSTVYRREL